MAYNDLDDFENNESKGLAFDFKGFLYKVIYLWKLVLLCIGGALVIAYFINVRKQNIYRLSSLISIETEQNPFFTANTSISFNWGGVSGKVGKVITSVKTRTHNEKVVDSLEYYMQYLKQGKYRFEDIYKQAPFYLKLNKTKGQILNTPIKIRFINDTVYEVHIEFVHERATAQIYNDRSKISVAVPIGQFNKTFSVGELMSFSFFNASLFVKPGFKITPDTEYIVRFLNFDGVVNGYKNNIKINPFSGRSSVLRLQLSGTNKSKIVDYLNTTAIILSKTELERKNLYATNTLKFIDSSLAVVDEDLKGFNNEMNDFRRKNKVFDVNDEIKQLSGELRLYDKEKEREEIKLIYLNNLESYLQTKTDYTNIAAPTSVGINEGNILTSVGKITGMAIERQKLEYTTREGSSLFKDLDRRIDAEKNVLFEIIDATTSIINIRLNTISRNIANSEIKLRDLPEDQQQYLRILRKLNISQESYDLYIAKRGEAAIVKAANVSDINIIDAAKDIGGGLIGPNTSLNYMMALMIGFFTPMFIIFVLFLLDNTIHGSDEVLQLSKIPILGLVGKYNYKNNLVVYEKPKSAVAESFRAIRSSLQFIFKNQEIDGGKTLLITSSVSGEGKTFCAINIATAYALSGLKTMLLGLDLRKPKIFGDFNINNDNGIINYLIGEKSFVEVRHSTHIENLDVITSGTVPPNPSEMLMSDSLNNLITRLRNEYDLIIFDTPPLGLVTDALELSQYADATIFMVRLDFTKKGMLQLINSKYRVGEVKI